MSHITEAVEQTSALQVDLEAGVIRGVKVCGNRSKNGRHYPTDVLEAAVPLYEGVPVYLNHGLLPGDERAIDVHFGNLQNVRVESGELFADLHYLKSHPQAAAIVERAQRFAKNFGLSHDAEIEATTDNQGQRVTRIVQVNSVDLVTRPATNNGIFEQEQTSLSKTTCTFKQLIEGLSLSQYIGKFAVLEALEREDDPLLKTAIEIPESGQATLKDATRQLILATLADTSLDEFAVLDQISEIVAQQRKLLGQDPAPVDNTQESWRSRAVAAEAELAGARDQVIESVLKTHGITPSARLTRTLRQLPNRAAMNAYLDGEELGPVLESQDYELERAEPEDLADYQPAQDDETFLSRMRM
ncbi:hypothetical protein DTL42_18345 [Bremerella cremea]|uniref:Uncharacterized protein n=1 Tax=Bremerella cremea TaxID=1031537 RepID=A0A368KML9_9BACT|nr:hypothetical protein [Bremerella cremea]RCS43947.1 hypothetical protein DTL42_18345 [Bremerella cremea]